MSSLRLTLGEELPVIFEGRRAVYVIMRAEPCGGNSEGIYLDLVPIVVSDPSRELPPYLNNHRLFIRHGDTLILMEDLKDGPAR